MGVSRFAALRRDYKKAELDEKRVARSPWKQFNRWFREAEASNLVEPNAMALATVDSRGRPSLRMVLLKDIAAGQLCFFTSYQSRKGRELKNNKAAALLFYWPELERQVRIEGHVVRLSPERSDRYFAGRPVGAQLSACASEQSSKVLSRQVLEERRSECAALIAESGAPVMRPKTWGGYGFVPRSFEFWQGRADRLHDRIFYELHSKRWRISRLAP